jgi:hypothetical protein
VRRKGRGGKGEEERERRNKRRNKRRGDQGEKYGRERWFRKETQERSIIEILTYIVQS